MEANRVQAKRPGVPRGNVMHRSQTNTNSESVAYQAYRSFNCSVFKARGVRKVTTEVTGLWQPSVLSDIAFYFFEIDPSYYCVTEMLTTDLAAFQKQKRLSLYCAVLYVYEEKLNSPVQLSQHQSRHLPKRNRRVVFLFRQYWSQAAG